MNRLVSAYLPLGGRAVRIFSRKFQLPAQQNVYRAQSRIDTACSTRVVAPLMQRCCVSSGSAEPFMNGTSAIYIEEMYESWQKDPASVHKSWDTFFTNVEQGYEPGVAYQSPPAVYGHPLKYEPVHSEIQPMPSTSSQVSDIDQQTTIDKHLAVSGLIRAYQTRGHSLAELDPLGILNADLTSRTPRELELETWKLSANDLNTQFRLPAFTRIGGTEDRLTLSEIQKRLRETYCKNIGVEYLFLTSQEKKDWLREQFETPGVMEQTNKEKDRLVARLLRATEFESFLAKKWPSEKRFGLEGCEVMIPALKHIIDISTDNGVNNIIMGMPHRGRLNVLANVCRKPLEHLFSQFNTELAYEQDEDGSSTSGDVKYHLGMTHERMNRMNNKTVTMSLCANPSHLEAVDPIVQGKTKAEQFLAKSKDGKEVMSILLHGDAAFSGQGVVYETFHLSDLPKFTTHGTIHIVVNNQIGFTTDPRMSRSSPYCTDVAKVVQCPIFHVNADNPEAVMHVCKVAAEYRHKFGKDVVIDLVCYRKNGHNEGDNPDFTQPIMYQKIRKQEPVVAKYSEQLIQQGVITRDEFKKKVSEYGKILNDAFDGAKENPRIKNADWLDSKWGDFFNPNDVMGTLEPTGIKMNDLDVLARKFATEPGHIKIHSGLKRVFKQRREMLDSGVADWAIGEYLAFSSLLKEGVHVRISGQDVERGTFSHRHHIIHDQVKDKVTYDMLSEVSENQAEYSVCNSSLSEYAVLGFELGYSMTNPQFLCIWEAQFGDFMNTAQCIIDQFISSGQDKWVRQSGLVMLLPHGMEGMGPEHSSARPERFLQMTKEDSDTFPDYDLNEFELQQNFQTNWFIVNITTPANFFHVLRRQVKLAFRKPLIVLTPKSLLRLESARSPLTDMAGDTTFQRVIPEDGPGCTENPENVKKLILCTGKIYYELKKERQQVGKTDDIAITRVEQIAPFPFDLIRDEMRKYPNAAIQWVQEEHKNHGYWQHVKPRIEACCDETDSRRPSYTGRATSASPATGNKKQHKLEAQQLLEDAMAL